MDGLDDRKNRAVIREALRDAVKVLVGAGDENITPPKLVYNLLEDAMRTLRRLPDRKYGVRTVWLPTANEYSKEGSEILESAEELEQFYLVNLPASPVAIKRMHVIFDLYPKLIVGRSKRRDYRVLCFMAMGTKITKIAKQLGISRQAVYDRKNLQCETIARRLSDLMPFPGDIREIQEAHERERTDREMRFLTMAAGEVHATNG